MVKKNYIYNNSIIPTAFLRFTDFSDPEDPNISKKENLLRAMRKYGIIVIDAFPFSLNKIDTHTFNFQNISRSSPKYKFLLDQVFSNHAGAKMQALKANGHDFRVLVRYKGLMEPLEPLLERAGFSKKGGLVQCIGSANHGVDRSLLSKLLLTQQS